MVTETEFGVGASLEVTIDQRSLAAARAEIEDELGDVSVGVGGSPTAITDGGRGVASAIDDASMIDELGDQTELLEDILDEFEAGGVVGSVGGGGGGGGGGGAGGIVSNYLEFKGLETTLSRASAPSIGTAGAASVGALSGLAGVNILERTGAMDDIERAGGQARQTLPFGKQIGDAAQFLPALSAASTLRPLAQGDLEGAKGNFADVWQDRMEVLQNINAATSQDYDTGSFQRGMTDTGYRDLPEDDRRLLEQLTRGQIDWNTDSLSSVAKQIESMDIDKPPWMGRLVDIIDNAESGQTTRTFPGISSLSESDLDLYDDLTSGNIDWGTDSLSSVAKQIESLDVPQPSWMERLPGIIDNVASGQITRTFPGIGGEGANGSVGSGGPTIPLPPGMPGDAREQYLERAGSSNGARDESDRRRQSRDQIDVNARVEVADRRTSEDIAREVADTVERRIRERMRNGRR